VSCPASMNRNVVPGLFTLQIGFFHRAPVVYLAGIITCDIPRGNNGMKKIILQLRQLEGLSYPRHPTVC
jgi:hypothetical protein